MDRFRFLVQKVFFEQFIYNKNADNDVICLLPLTAKWVHSVGHQITTSMSAINIQRFLWSNHWHLGKRNKKVELYAIEIKLKNTKHGGTFVAVRDAINSRDDTRAPSNYGTNSKRFINYSPNCTVFDHRYFKLQVIRLI